MPILSRQAEENLGFSRAEHRLILAENPCGYIAKTQSTEMAQMVSLQSGFFASLQAASSSECEAI